MRDYLASRLNVASNAKNVQVGFLETAEYPDGLKIAQVAFWNEFGTVNQVPRPFFRRMIAEESKHWGDDVAKAMKALNYDAASAFASIGESIKDALVVSINEFSSPALRPSTIKRKGFSKPLIDTGKMRDAVAYRVTT
jgi:hypothetical protein